MANVQEVEKVQTPNFDIFQNTNTLKQAKNLLSQTTQFQAVEKQSPRVAEDLKRNLQ